MLVLKRSLDDDLLIRVGEVSLVVRVVEIRRGSVRLGVIGEAGVVDVSREEALNRHPDPAVAYAAYTTTLTLNNAPLRDRDRIERATAPTRDEEMPTPRPPCACGDPATIILYGTPYCPACEDDLYRERATDGT